MENIFFNLHFLTLKKIKFFKKLDKKYFNLIIIYDIIKVLLSCKKLTIKPVRKWRLQEFLIEYFGALSRHFNAQ